MKKIAKMKKPKGMHETFEMTYSDGQSRTVYVTEREQEIDSHVIYSSTDLFGKIKKVNDAFISASGWKEKELLGAEHYILRHPHMPEVAFYDMWEQLKAKDHWYGYVKNLCKDGGYYWVHAMVTATRRNGEVVGYQSARHKITDEKKAYYENLYATLRQYPTLVEQITAFEKLSSK